MNAPRSDECGRESNRKSRSNIQMTNNDVRNSGRLHIRPHKKPVPATEPPATKASGPSRRTTRQSKSGECMTHRQKSHCDYLLCRINGRSIRRNKATALSRPRCIRSRSILESMVRCTTRFASVKVQCLQGLVEFSTRMAVAAARLRVQRK